MEYLGTGWKTDLGISPLAMPVTYQDWTGRIDGQIDVLLHMVTSGASPAFTLDIPSEQVRSAPATPSQHGDQVSLAIAIPGHPAVIAGSMNAAGDTLTGTFSQGSKSQALILRAGPARQ